MTEKKLYFRVYQDKENMDSFYVDTKRNTELSIDSWIEEHNETDEPMPVIEPILMTEKEFEDLPEFEGFNDEN